MIHSVTFFKRVLTGFGFGDYRYEKAVLNGEWGSIDDACDAACKSGADCTKTMLYV